MTAGLSQRILREGTPVWLISAEDWSSKTAKNGGPVTFILASDTEEDGVIVASGPVTAVRGPAVSGKTLTGRVQVGIKLQDAPLVVSVGVNAKQNGIAMTAAQQIAYLDQLKQKQDAVMAQVTALGGKELGRVSKGHNALAVSIDSSALAAIHGITGVVAVRPLADYQVSSTPVPDLTTTDAYIGATAVQARGFTGQGIRVAMLDTGIDFTHYNLGGSENVADYNAALAAASGTPPPSLFPTTKVIGGYDFTGEV